MAVAKTEGTEVMTLVFFFRPRMKCKNQLLNQSVVGLREDRVLREEGLKKQNKTKL